jgi:hypothetical protein
VGLRAFASIRTENAVAPCGRVACGPRGNDLQHAKLSILGESAPANFHVAINMSSTTMKRRTLPPEIAHRAPSAIHVAEFAA